MKLTTAAVLALVATSVLGNPISFKPTAVSARDLYERDGGEAFLESFEKRGGGSLFETIAKLFGTMSGRVANTSTQNGLSKHFFPPPKPAATPTSTPHPVLRHHPPQVLPQRRSLDARVKRRALSRPVVRKQAGLLIP